MIRLFVGTMLLQQIAGVTGFARAGLMWYRLMAAFDRVMDRVVLKVGTPSPADVRYNAEVVKFRKRQWKIFQRAKLRQKGKFGKPTPNQEKLKKEYETDWEVNAKLFNGPKNSNELIVFVNHDMTQQEKSDHIRVLKCNGKRCFFRVRPDSPEEGKWTKLAPSCDWCSLIIRLCMEIL